MQTAQAQKIVIIGTFVTLGSTIGGSLSKNGSLPPTKQIVSTFLAMLGCSVLAELDGELGAGLAIAISGTAFVRDGLPELTNRYSGPVKKTSLPATNLTQFPTPLPTSPFQSPPNSRNANITPVAPRVPVAPNLPSGKVAF